MNLGNVVKFWAHRQPQAEAIITDGRTTTWADLDQQTNRIAHGLTNLDVAKGDRIAILSENCSEYLELVIAAYKIGAILVPLNVRLTATEVRHIVTDAGCKCLVSDEVHAATAASALQQLQDNNILAIDMATGSGIPYEELKSADVTAPTVDVTATDLAYIQYTSGTTGRPKGAMLSHGNVLAMANHRILDHDMVTHDRIYLPYPLSFTGGILTTWAPAYVCGATFVLDAQVDPARILHIIEYHNITVFSAVPVIWSTLLQHPEFANHDLSSLRVCSSGGASSPLPLLQALKNAGLPIAQGYGLTEGSGFTCWLPAEDGERKLGSCGKPAMHTQIRIVDPQSTELVDLGQGEVGELVIKGPEITSGYWKAPEETARTLIDGWLRTGDLAREDEEGYFYIVDRSKDMLISGGLNVYPAEIESVISGLPGVTECAVIGVPHEQWGETPVAVLVSKAGELIDVEQVIETCREQLADYKQPTYIVTRSDPLPRGMSGKVLKQELRKEYDNPEALGQRLK